jgi:hypothetical protein
MLYDEDLSCKDTKLFKQKEEERKKKERQEDINKLKF